MTKDIIDAPLVTIRKDGGIAMLIIDRPPANALSQSLRRALNEALTQLQNDNEVEGIVLTGAGKVFIAGAEISELGQPLQPSLPDVIALLERSAKPTAAALHGFALGGGFEIALACNMRVAEAGTKVGLPEVKLGILPGAGGTVRVTRLAGAEAALRLAGSGDPIPVDRAQGMGLVDHVVEGDAATAAADLLRQAIAAGTVPAAVRNRELAGPADAEALAKLRDTLNKKARSTAANRVLAVAEAAAAEDFDTALAQERTLFLEAVASPESAALRHLFFAEREAAKSGLSNDVKAREIRHVGVVGAGTMGRGIAMAFANSGFTVALHDASADSLAAAAREIESSNKRLAASGRVDEAEAAKRTAAITAAPALEDLAECDLIVEAAFEEMGVKRDIFARLDQIARQGAILGTNTSYLDVNQIAAATRRPQDVIGLHFFSPAHIMKLLEIVRAQETADDVLQTAVTLAKRLKKQAVVVGVCRGFVGNRMLQVRNRAVPELLVEGARPEQIDAAFRDLGWPMGPCEMQDLAGLDISWRMRKAEGISESIADTLCEAGRFGRKTGRGWYDYEDGKQSPSPEVQAVIKKIGAERGIAQRDIGSDEIIARTHDPMIAEGEAILAEGIARSRGDIDVVWVNGYGFPRTLGGPMHWHDNRGASDE